MPGATLERLFRHEYGRLVAALTRVFGPHRLDLVEDVVQDAMLKAMRSWPYLGVPDDPAAWITGVARNSALDAIRRSSMAESKGEALRAREAARAEQLAAAIAPDEVPDDTLRMIFTCSHPALPPDARVALTLKTLCGFGVREIASALLAKEASIAQRLSRAKAKLQRESVQFEVPAAGALDARLDSVLEVLYLTFNEGYRAHRGAELVRVDLVHDALRLGEVLTTMPETDQPKVHALLALMRLLGARIPARIDDAGALLTLAEQDRRRWDRHWLGAGFAALRRATAGSELTSYHIEASIASLHALAPSYEETDWAKIRARYDDLLALTGSPIVRLNRAVAIAKSDGIAAARAEIDALSSEPMLAEYVLLPATRAHLAWLAGDRAAAAEAYAAALEQRCTEPERVLLERRRAACSRGDPPPAF